MKKLLFLSIITFFALSFSGVVSAGVCPPELKAKPGTVCLDNPLASRTNPLKNTDAKELIGTLIKGALGVMGSLSLLMLVWGGFQWLTSAGNTEKVEKGSNTMIWAIIGVIVVMSSYVLVDTLTRVLSTGR